MSVKDIFWNIITLFIFFLSGVSAGYSMTLYMLDTFPLNPIDMSGNPIGIILVPIFAFLMCAFITLILTIILFSMKKRVRASLLRFCKKENKISVVLRVIGYLSVVKLIYDSIDDALVYKCFFLNGLWYYSSAVIWVMSGMLLILTIAAKTLSENSSCCTYR